VNAGENAPRSGAAPAHGVRAVVFDLDDTLYDCLGQCVGPAHREAAKAMVEAGAHATIDEVLEVRLSLAGLHVLDLDDAVAASFRATSPVRVAEAGRRAFFERDPGSLTPFPFAIEVVRRVRASCPTVLLSTGHPPTQRKKVEALGLQDVFDEVMLEPGLGRHDKEEALRRWLGRGRLAAAEVLVVGDRSDAEIAAANRLGMQALRVKGGEFAGRPTPQGVPEVADVRGVLPYLGLEPLA
jgi:FMN phosphatase YigB (HAD superfamily)